MEELEFEAEGKLGVGRVDGREAVADGRDAPADGKVDDAETRVDDAEPRADDADAGGSVNAADDCDVEGAGMEADGKEADGNVFVLWVDANDDADVTALGG